MRKLILIKHAMPEVVPGVPAHLWGLLEDGKRSCLRLAEQLEEYRPATLYASSEAKAIATASALAERFHQPYAVCADLREHDRATAGFLGRDEFERAVAALFAHPDELAFGNETAAAALSRFTAAVTRILAQDGSEHVMLVTHGTVIALYLAAWVGMDGLQMWHALGLPSYVVLAVPEPRALDVVTSLDVQLARPVLPPSVLLLPLLPCHRALKLAQRVGIVGALHRTSQPRGAVTRVRALLLASRLRCVRQ